MDRNGTVQGKGKAPSLMRKNSTASLSHPRRQSRHQCLRGRQGEVRSVFRLSCEQGEVRSVSGYIVEPYYFVLDNSFSMFTDKQVQGSVTLKWDQ